MEAIYIAYVAGSFWVSLPLIYWGTAPDWWKSRTGRALMTLFTSLALVFILIVTSSMWGAYPLREAARYVVYSWAAVAAIRIAALLFQLRLGANWASEKKPPTDSTG